MKNKLKIFLLLIVTSFYLCSCSSYKYNINALKGSNIQDLQQINNGKEKIFSNNVDLLFDKTIQILKDNKLTIFKQDKKEQYIIAMNFHKQVNTTRVGIFFETIETNKTKIILKSLSSTANEKAAQIIFKNLENNKKSQTNINLEEYIK